ncbi:MAG TPA: hypothetical protein VGO39_09625, partial [Gaiellaceae bacterium]|nr:hypothetical protein [Gaiellaceae bacterium]
SGRAFTTGIVEPVVDDDEAPVDTDADRALEIFSELAQASENDVDVPDPLSPIFDFEVAARVDFATDAKQKLLSTTSPRERMATLVGLLEVALEAVRLELTLRERASRNGKVAPLEPE